jgi:hypothetical protein
MKPPKQGDVHEADFSDRADQFLELVEQLTKITDNREAAFAAVFGYRGLYITELPTLDERMAFRDVPLARAKLFSFLYSRPLATRRSLKVT